jgi:hypothetical protein
MSGGMRGRLLPAISSMICDDSRLNARGEMPILMILISYGHM